MGITGCRKMSVEDRIDIGQHEAMMSRALRFLSGEDVNHHQIAADVQELLNERRELIATIRSQRIILSNREAILSAVSRGYESVKVDLHRA